MPGPNQDQNDGQGCFNALRVSQASALAGILSGVANAIVIGDLNAYSKEDPIQTLGGAGFTGVAGLHVPDAERYSYLFDGQSGELDHILVGADLLDNVTGATIWHINADEPLILDYNTEFNPASLYVPDAFRSSDHDPLIMGLDLNTAPTVDAGGPYTVVEGGTVGVAAAGIDPDAADLLTYEWDLDGDGTFETPGQTPTFSAAGLDAPQTRTISVRVTDLGGLTATDSASVSIIWNFAGFLWPRAESALGQRRPGGLADPVPVQARRQPGDEHPRAGVSDVAAGRVQCDREWSDDGQQRCARLCRRTPLRPAARRTGTSGRPRKPTRVRVASSR